MNPIDWAALGLGLALLCLIAEAFISASKNSEARARADVEELLRKANKEITNRPRIRAGTTPTLPQNPSPLSLFQRTHHD